MRVAGKNKEDVIKRKWEKTENGECVLERRLEMILGKQPRIPQIVLGKAFLYWVIDALSWVVTMRLTILWINLKVSLP